MHTKIQNVMSVARSLDRQQHQYIQSKRGRKPKGYRSPEHDEINKKINSVSVTWKHIMDNNNPLTREEERDASATDLVMHNMRFMFSHFKKYLLWMSIDEYCSEIVAGLYDAANRFDRDAGIKFFTYAKSYVNLYLINYKRRMENSSSVNASAINKVECLKTFIANYQEQFDRSPTKKEILDKFHYTPKMYKQYMYYAKALGAISIDMKMEESGSGSNVKTVGDMIMPEHVVGQENIFVNDEYENKDLKENLKTAINKLSSTEQYVITELHLNNSPYSKISKQIHCNNNEIRRIEQSALNKLKEYLDFKPASKEINNKENGNKENKMVSIWNRARQV